jgi:hypothetical protein
VAKAAHDLNQLLFQSLVEFGRAGLSADAPRMAMAQNKIRQIKQAAMTLGGDILNIT